MVISSFELIIHLSTMEGTSRTSVSAAGAAGVGTVLGGPRRDGAGAGAGGEVG